MHTHNCKLHFKSWKAIFCKLKQVHETTKIRDYKAHFNLQDLSWRQHFLQPHSCSLLGWNVLNSRESKYILLHSTYTTALKIASYFCNQSAHEQKPNFHCKIQHFESYAFLENGRMNDRLHVSWIVLLRVLSGSAIYPIRNLVLISSDYQLTRRVKFSTMKIRLKIFFEIWP